MENNILVKRLQDDISWWRKRVETLELRELELNSQIKNLKSDPLLSLVDRINILEDKLDEFSKNDLQNLWNRTYDYTPTHGIA